MRNIKIAHHSILNSVITTYFIYLAEHIKTDEIRKEYIW